MFSTIYVPDPLLHLIYAIEDCTKVVQIFQATWNGTRAWCEQNGMQQAALKTLDEIEQITRQLKERSWKSEFILKMCVLFK